MPIISVRDNDNNTLKRNKKNNQRQKIIRRGEGGRSSSERVRAKWFWCVFKLSFFQLIWKASLIFKPLSILLQQCLLQNLGVVILDHKLYDNTIQEIISGTSKFKILNEDPNLKHQVSLQLFLRKLKQKKLF